MIQGKHVTIIAAMDKNNGIGKDNALPWKLPEDLKRFKHLTAGAAVIQGRKTYDSIAALGFDFGLAGRENIVISRSLQIDTKVHTSFATNGPEHTILHTATSLEDAVRRAIRRHIFIIGGAEIYAQAIEFADRMQLTHIDGEYDCDTFFPQFSKERFVEVTRQMPPAGAVHKPSYYFSTYDCPSSY